MWPLLEVYSPRVYMARRRVSENLYPIPHGQESAVRNCREQYTLVDSRFTVACRHARTRRHALTHGLCRHWRHLTAMLRATALQAGSGYQSQDTSLRIPVSGFRIPVSGFRIQDTSLRIQDTSLRIPVSGYQSEDARDQIQGRGVRRGPEGPGVP